MPKTASLKKLKSNQAPAVLKTTQQLLQELTTLPPGLENLQTVLKRVKEPQAFPIDPSESDVTQMNNETLQKHIATLLEKDFPKRKAVQAKDVHTLTDDEKDQLKRINFLLAYLKDAKSNKELKPIQQAIRHYHELNEAEERYRKLQKEFNQHSIYSIDIIDHLIHHELKQNINKYKNEVLTKGLGAGTLCIINNNFDMIEIEKKKLKFTYPDSYKTITHKQPDSILQVISLFEDYHKKNHIFFFHWRHYSKEAKEINNELRKILSSKDSDTKKLTDATQIILNKTKSIAEKLPKGMLNNDSSFVRRSRYAIELLDAARVAIENTPKPKKLL